MTWSDYTAPGDDFAVCHRLVFLAFNKTKLITLYKMSTTRVYFLFIFNIFIF